MTLTNDRSMPYAQINQGKLERLFPLDVIVPVRTYHER